jgi:PIN domain nuclease of toxin-antitoxin system
MRLLLDTNALIWLLEENHKLGPRARAMMQAAAALVVADASLWELAIKVSVGKLRTIPNFASVIGDLGFERPTMTARLFETLAELPLRHRDPFDRMLIAQALSDDLTVVTSDPIFAMYGVRVVDATA